MNKIKYSSPDIEIIEIKESDVIVTSGEPNYDEEGDPYKEDEEEDTSSE